MDDIFASQQRVFQVVQKDMSIEEQTWKHIVTKICTKKQFRAKYNLNQKHVMTVETEQWNPLGFFRDSLNQRGGSNYQL